jgi:hypothetical protein
VFPDWVGQDNEGYKTLTVRGLAALTVESLRELKRQNEALQCELTTKTQRLAEVEDRLARLESLVERLADGSGD